MAEEEAIFAREPKKKPWWEKKARENVRMRRNGEVQFHLSGLIIRSKVIIKSCFQGGKKKTCLRKGGNAIFFEPGNCMLLRSA